MPIEIIVPRLGWSMEEGAFVAWLKQDGESVRAGDPLFSIEGDKAVQEIESIDSGILRITADGPKPGDSIHVGDVLGHLLAADEAMGESGPASPGKPVTPSSPVETQPSAKARTFAAQVPQNHPSPPTSAPAISPRALRVAAELGVDWTRVTGSGRTGRIREQDIRAATGAMRTITSAVNRSEG
jgi:pyruvate dehydrogenase E2 component (dihydrolipoamide acetyltransferase)